MGEPEPRWPARLKVKLAFSPEPVGAVGMVGLRLGEHELHYWDGRGSFDLAARIEDSAAKLRLDGMPDMVP